MIEIIEKTQLLAAQLNTELKTIAETQGANKFIAQAIYTVEELKMLMARLKILSNHIKNHTPKKSEGFIESINDV